LKKGAVMALEVMGLAKSYGGVRAVRGIDFSVRAGECVALIGPNGAGKSTTFACIAGQARPDSGTVTWRGHPLSELNPAQRLAVGVARTFQVAQVFDALSVWHNLALVLPVMPPGALSSATRWLPWRRLPSPGDDAACAGIITALLGQVGLAQRADAVAGSLAYGDRKRLELAIALAGIAGASQAPCLLLLDEPAAGLAAAERAALMATVRSLVDGAQSPLGLGPMAVLYTEHNMDAVFGVADRVLVLIEGQIVAQGAAADIARNPEVRMRYLGHDALQTLGAYGA
jgi:branched-chain amino acid transport system ATP-binding protein